MTKSKIIKDRSYAAFWALMKRMPQADKEAIVYEWTGGRTASLKEMTDKEYIRMIGGLNAFLKGKENDEKTLRCARSRALHQLQLYGVNTTNWNEINHFVSQPRIAGKVFAALNIQELVALTMKMRAIIDRKHKLEDEEAFRLSIAAISQERWKKQSSMPN